MRTIAFDGVAQVTVAVHGTSSIELASCTPDPGWACRVETNGPTTITVKFRRTSGDGEAQLEIRLGAGGRLDVQAER